MPVSLVPTHGLANSSFGRRLQSMMSRRGGIDINALRPWEEYDEDRDLDTGRTFITTNERQQDGSFLPRNITVNATSTLRVREWIELDKAVIRAYRPRLKAFQSLRDMGLEYNIPNALGKTVIQYHQMSDTTTAVASMDGLRESQMDRNVFGLQAMPLPIFHKDFKLSLRELMESRNGNTPFDTTLGENAARRVADLAEQTYLGTVSPYTYGSGSGVAGAGGSVYGLTTLPQRNTYTMRNPATGVGWTPADTLNDVLQMRLALQQAFRFGPYALYTSLPWDTYLDDDFSAAKANITLRDRLENIRGIDEIIPLDFLTGYQMILVQKDTETVRAVVGMDVTTIQWESQGGMELNFKVMAIMLPQLRFDINGNCGIDHGNAP